MSSRRDAAPNLPLPVGEGRGEGYSAAESLGGSASSPQPPSGGEGAWPAAPRSSVTHGEPLARHTSLRVGGPARAYLESDRPEVLGRALAEASASGEPVLMLGGGSNLLVADAGFDGLVIKYTADEYRVEPAGRGGVLTAAAGLTWGKLASRLARDGWAGLEWAATVPGTIGGAAVNNAGAFGSDMAGGLIALELLDRDGERRRLSRSDLAYAYRTSSLKRGELGPVLVTTLRCAVHRDDPEAVLARIRANRAQRTATQPRENSAGSVFANPPGDFSGRLIEAAGLKGARLGGAEISRLHANFIVNAGSAGGTNTGAADGGVNPGPATAGDIYAVIRLVQDTVWRRFQVWLHPEIQLVGAWPSEQIADLAGPPGGGAGPR